jgi:hypothetical protein
MRSKQLRDFMSWYQGIYMGYDTMHKEVLFYGGDGNVMWVYNLENGMWTTSRNDNYLTEGKYLQYSPFINDFPHMYYLGKNGTVQPALYSYNLEREVDGQPFILCTRGLYLNAARSKKVVKMVVNGMRDNNYATTPLFIGLFVSYDGLSFTLVEHKFYDDSNRANNELAPHGLDGDAFTNSYNGRFFAVLIMGGHGYPGTYFTTLDVESMAAIDG